MADPIKVPNLAELRRSLRALDRESLRVVQQVTKRGAELVAKDAGPRQTRGTRPLGRRAAPRRLADSYRATTSGNNALVRNPLAHGPVEEYRRRGPHAVNRALDAKQDDVALELERGFDDLARSQGWR
jgi:hypothetical protein